jgi:PAS domain S-box-containing protein
MIAPVDPDVRRKVIKTSCLTKQNHQGDDQTMSEQKKTAAKPVARKLSSQASRKISRKTPAKTGVKAASVPLKRPPRKISPDGKGLIEERCRVILREIEENYYEEDLQGNITFVNDAPARSLGYSSKELIGVNYLSHCDAATAEKIQECYARTQKTGKPFSGLEVTVSARDGSKRIFEISGALIRDAQGKPAGFRGILRDITERKRIERELRESEERYRSILDATDEGFCEFDLEGNITLINHAGAKIIGYTPQEIIGKNFRLFIDPADEANLLNVFKNIYKTRRTMKRVESPIIDKDGQIRFLEISGAVLCDAAGNPAGFRSMYYDITERKWARDALQQSETKYSSVIESIGVAYFETDLRGVMTFVNDQTCLELGYSREELMRMSAKNFQTAENAKKTFNVFHQVYETGQPAKNYEMEAIHKNGDVVFFELSILLQRDAMNKPIGFRGLARNVTRRKKMETELQRSEERYRTILEEIEEGYAELDLTCNWTFVNEAAAKILGYPSQELAGFSIRRNMDDAAVQELLELYEKLHQTGQTFKHAEIELITKEGNRRMAEVSGVLIRDEQGRPAGFRSLIRDITERKWSEDALLQSEAKYFSIIESIGDAYFETDLRGMMTFVNDRTCLDLGYTWEELIRMSTRDYQTPENAQKTFDVFKQVYETGQPLKAHHFEAIRKDGANVTFEMSISLMRDSQGRPIGFRGLSRDITERKRMEDALRASEERARTIIATIPDPYFENNLRGKFTYVNSAFKSYSGYTDDEIKDVSFKVFVDASYVDELFSLYNSVYTTGLPVKNVELEAIMKSGEKRLVNLSVSLIRDSRGDATGFSGIIRDITDKKKAEKLIRQSEQSLREYSETLELRVKERTAELEKAKVAAEAASRAKSDFMSHISHEFQTPLNAVIGFTKVLHDRMFGEINEKQEEFLRYIADAGANLSRIITQIVDASQATSGHMKLNLSPVSIVEAISKSTRLVAPLTEEKNQILTVNVDLDADVSIEGDGQKIQQIFFNLLSNAVKYTGEGGSIDIHASRKEQPASLQEGVSVAIKDTGTGIKASDIPRLFEAFGTLESTYTRSEKGIGVGLSLTKQLVELHGGDIGVESEFGSGSCFTVFLPMKQKSSGVKE